MLGLKSIKLLNGVHPDLTKVIVKASEIYEGKFVVTEGVRTLEKQKILYSKGASTTLRSRHIPEVNKCGLGCAVDLGVWLDINLDDSVNIGEIRWDWSLYYKLAEAMQIASIDLSIPIEWGGVWDKEMTQYESPELECEAYVARKRAEYKKKGIAKKPFIDGPHFQLAWRVYP